MIFIHVYSSGTGADSPLPRRQSVDVYKNDLSLNSFVASVKKNKKKNMSLKSDFKQFVL